MSEPMQRCETSWITDGELHECLFRHIDGYHLCDCGERLEQHDARTHA